MNEPEFLKHYKRIRVPKIPDPARDIVRSYDGKMVPRNAGDIVGTLRTRIELQIDLAYRTKAMCVCDNPEDMDCHACEAVDEYLADAAMDIVRQFPPNAYELPWEIIRNALLHCLERKLVP